MSKTCLIAVLLAAFSPAYAAGAPARVAVLGLTQVVFAMGFDVVLWHRTFSAASLAGTVLVLAPTAWLVRRGTTAAPVRKMLVSAHDLP